MTHTTNNERLRIVAIVRLGIDKGKCIYNYVFNRPIKKAYTKIDKETIIGKDEGALSFYRLELSRQKAFGGAKFSLPLTDGTTEQCNGQWWDGMTKAAEALYNPNDIGYIGCSSVEELKDCYIFKGGYCQKEWLKNLVAEYKGEVYDYCEYEQIINK